MLYYFRCVSLCDLVPGALSVGEREMKTSKFILMWLLILFSRGACFPNLFICDFRFCFRSLLLSFRDARLVIHRCPQSYSFIETMPNIFASELWLATNYCSHSGSIPCSIMHTYRYSQEFDTKAM
jgi:hypothetical protein